MRKILLILMLLVLFSNCINAELFQFDNVKSYDAVKQEVTITNTFGLGGDIAKIKLNTPLLVKTGYGGVFKVAEFQVINLKDYTNAFENIEFYNERKNMEKISREVEYKVKSYETIVINDYKEVCLETFKNGTSICEQVLSGTHTEQKEVWISLEKADFLKDEIKTIGIFTYVYKEDYVEWVPTFYGVKINEWASWISSLDTDIKYYWSCDEGTGTNANDNVSNNDITLSGAIFQAGKVGNACYFDGSDDYGQTSSVLDITNGSISIHFWYYSYSKPLPHNNPFSSFNSNGYPGFQLQGVSNESYITLYNTLGGAQQVPHVWRNGTWTEWVIVSNTTEIRLYENGVYVKKTNLASTPDGNALLTLGKDMVNGGREWNGLLDEFGIWTRALTQTEITNLYNGGNGIRYGDYGLTSPRVTLNSPIDYFNSTSQTIIFNTSVIENNAEGIISNVTLYIDGIVNETNTSNINGTYIFTKILSDGFHNWSILAYNNNSLSNQSATRNLTIDTTNPSINISYPANTTYITPFPTENNLSVWFNWTASHPSFGALDKCWYSYDNGVTNNTITCNANASNYFTYGQRTFIAWVNDTNGHLGTDRVTASYDYYAIINSETYNLNTTETFTEQFIINLSLNSGITLNSAIFNYNGTTYSPSINSTGSYKIISRYIGIPSISVTANASFFWTLNLSSGVINTTAHNQTINILNIDNCAANTILILNYTIYDEDERNLLDAAIWNTSANIYVKLSGDLTGNIYEFYSNRLTTNPITFCVNSSLLSGKNYKLDAQIQYTADDYVTEYNYIENYTLNTTTPHQNVSLYLLLINRSQEFLITFKDLNLIPVEGALIEISRQYLDLPGFLSVEISKTDNDGRTIGHFVLNDEVYTIYVKKNGVLLSTYENVRAFCSNIATGDCTINLNQIGTTTNPSSFTNYLDIIGNEEYNDTSKVYTFTFTTADSSTKTINVTIYRFDVNLTTTICSEQLTSSSGTITCTIPSAFYNSTALVKINVDNILYSTGIFDITTDKAASGLTATRYLLAFFLIITIPLIAFTSGPMMLLLFIVGLITAGGLALIDWGGFIGPLSAFLWFVIAAVILIAKASKRREQ